MIDQPRWTPDELEKARQEAIRLFRKRRMEEPLEEYLEAFDDYQGIVEDLLEATVDLSALPQHALEVVTNSKFLEAFRYTAGPPVSEDDLETVAEAVLTPARLHADVDMVERIVTTVMQGLDRRRFPWISENREPTEAEKAAAIVASAALLATRRSATARRHRDKDRQEQQVEDALCQASFRKVQSGTFSSVSQAPGRGMFCRESAIGGRKADFVVRLWDDRILPIECKVSNSATNSVKRLNNDAAVKATVWKKDFGELHVVPAAVLSGVYKLKNLIDAQNRGLALFWAHDLPALMYWIEQTR
jgi:hypothetical protein